MRDQKLLRSIATTIIVFYFVPPMIKDMGMLIFATVFAPMAIFVWLTPLVVSACAFYLSRKTDLSKFSSEVFICVFLGLIIVLIEVAVLISAFKSGEWWPQMGPLRM